MKAIQAPCEFPRSRSKPLLQTLNLTKEVDTFKLFLGPGNSLWESKMALSSRSNQRIKSKEVKVIVSTMANVFCPGKSLFILVRWEIDLM
jgi:hypothetical protein